MSASQYKAADAESKSKSDTGNNPELFSNEDSDKVLEALSTLALSVNTLPVGDSRQVALLTNPELDQDYSATRTNLSRLLTSVSAPSTAPSALASGIPEEEAMVRIHSQTLEHSLEKANAALDLAAGFRDTPLTDAEAKADARALQKSIPNAYSNRLPENYKPQYEFRDQPLDNSEAPFVPPFVQFDFTPLPPPTPSPEASEEDAPASESEDSEVKKQSDSEANVDKEPESDACDNDDGGDGESKKKDGRDPKRKRTLRKPKPKKREKVGTLHPFKKEILDSVADNIAKEPFSAENVRVQKSMEKTPFTYVTTAQELLAVMERFSKCTEIAIDLEHHSQRTFLGFTCLIQMSTRLEDVVVDVLKIRSGTIHAALAPIFADPTVTKVLHGADNDIEWLERDFGLYIVNMFDTGQAARVLNYPNASLNYLLNTYCQVKVDGKKTFQRADWRIRPIPDSMMKYARADTHYLLYIYDRLRIELYSKDGDQVKQVYQKSGGVSLHRFRKPLYVPGVALKNTVKNGLGLDKYQVAILENLFKWRWDTARAEDESPQFLARDYWLIPLARARTKARTPDGVILVLNLAAIRGARFVRKYCADIASIIASTLDSDVPELPAKKSPKKKTEDNNSNSCSSSSYSSTPSRGREKKSNRRAAPESEDSKGKVSPTRKLSPSAAVFTPLKSRTTNTSKKQPSVRVRDKRASLLFDSDSGSVSERSSSSPSQSQRSEDKNTSPLTVNESNFPSLGGPKKSRARASSDPKSRRNETNSSSTSSVASKQTRDVVVAAKVTSLSNTGSNFPGLGGAKAPTVTSAKKSVFDLSESESNEEDMANARTLDKRGDKMKNDNYNESDEEASRSKRSMDTVSKVKAGMPNVDTGFSEVWATEKEGVDGGETKADAATDEVKVGEQSEEEIVALCSLRKSNKKKKKNRPSKSTNKEKVEATEGLELYDFLAEIEKDKQKKREDSKKNNTNVKNEVFKGLKETKRNKTRRSKKNPASGSRSMTFSTAN